MQPTNLRPTSRSLMMTIAVLSMMLAASAPAQQSAPASGSGVEGSLQRIANLLERLIEQQEIENRMRRLDLETNVAADLRREVEQLQDRLAQLDVEADQMTRYFEDLEDRLFAAEGDTDAETAERVASMRMEQTMMRERQTQIGSERQRVEERLVDREDELARRSAELATLRQRLNSEDGR